MNERGDALLETVLIAPVLLLLGLVATEFGVSALRRSQLSESIRSVVNLELINARDSEVLQDGRSMEILLSQKLNHLPSIDETHLPEVKVKLYVPLDELDVKLPFFSPDGETIQPNKPKKVEVRVKAYCKTLFRSYLNLPPLEEIVTYRLRG